MTKRSEKSQRVRVIVERHEKSAGYSIWRKGIRVAKQYYNDPIVERKMGPKRKKQWWSAVIDPKMFTITLLQPLNRPVECCTTDKEMHDG